MNLLRRQTTPHPPTAGTLQNPVPPLPASSWPVILLSALLIMFVCLYVRHQIALDRDRTLAAAMQDTMNLAIACEENVRGVFANSDLILINIKHLSEREGPASPAVTAYIRAAGKYLGHGQISVCDRHGVIVASLLERARGTSIADRDHFAFHRDFRDASLRIGRPIFGRTSQSAQIPLTRWLDGPDGSFAGVAFVGLDIDNLAKTAGMIDLGPGKAIALLGTDGFLRFRLADDAVTAGEDLKLSRLWEYVKSGYSAHSFVTTSILDGVERVFSYRLLKDYPLIIYISQATGVALAPFEKRRNWTVTATLLFSLLIAGLCVLFVDRQRKQRAFHLEREETLRTLRRANARLNEQARLLELASDYIVVSGLDGRVIYWNKGAEAGYGWTAAEALGRTRQSLLRPSPPEPAALTAAILEKGRWQGEQTHTRKDGRQVFVNSYRTLNRDAAGEPVSILEINRDITEQKIHEANMTRLDQLNTVGEMAASIGHEIRNPLTTVRGYLQLFERRQENAAYREQFATMIEELDRANAIISEFLALAKNKAIDRRPRNLNRIINLLLPLLQAEALHRGQNVVVALADVPDVDLDDKEIRQLLLNLVRNGFEAMAPGGTVSIGTRFEPGRVVLVVADTGGGIPPEVLDKLGTPFLTTKEAGTGLGLAVCYRIAERHGATIDVQSSPQGTTFTVGFKTDPTPA